MSTRARLLLGALFLVHALPFLVRPTLIGGDEPHYALMAHSLAVDRDLDLEADYRAVERGSTAAGRKFAGRSLERHLVPRSGELHFSHPLGLPALAAPPLALLQALSPGAAPDALLGGLGLLAGFVGLLAGYDLLRRLTPSAADARLLAFALYFTTPLWFYSRVFFTEVYTWSLLALSLWLLARGRPKAASATLGAIFLIKEVNALLILPVLGAVWMRSGRRRAALFAIGPLVAFALWIAKNLALYGEPLVTFQRFQLGDPVGGAVGLLIDPRHGLLPFAPVLVLALVAAVRPTRRTPAMGALEAWALGAFLGVYALTACWQAWGGGSSYGPRLLVPVVPALAVSLAAGWERWRGDRRARFFVSALLAAGFALQWLAVTDPFLALWEPSVLELVGRRPLMAAIGLAIGYAATRRLLPPAGGTERSA